MLSFLDRMATRIYALHTYILSFFESNLILGSFLRRCNRALFHTDCSCIRAIPKTLIQWRTCSQGNFSFPERRFSDVSDTGPTQWPWQHMLTTMSNRVPKDVIGARATTKQTIARTQTSNDNSLSLTDSLGLLTVHPTHCISTRSFSKGSD